MEHEVVRLGRRRLEHRQFNAKRLEPNDPLANPDNLSVVWYGNYPTGSASRAEIVLDYVSTQIRIEIVPANHTLSLTGAL